MISLPFVLRVSVYADSDTDRGKLRIKLFFIPIFSKKINVKAIKAKLSGEVSHSDGDNEDDNKKQRYDSDGKSGSSALKKLLVDFALETLKFMRVRDMSLTARIGTGDAASSAIAAGAISAAFGNACAIFGAVESDSDIKPDYDVETLYFDFFGIFSISFADIIFVALCVICSKLFRRRAKRSNYANTVTQ